MSQNKILANVDIDLTVSKRISFASSSWSISSVAALVGNSKLSCRMPGLSTTGPPGTLRQLCPRTNLCPQAACWSPMRQTSSAPEAAMLLSQEVPAKPALQQENWRGHLRDQNVAVRQGPLRLAEERGEERDP